MAENAAEALNELREIDSYKNKKRPEFVITFCGVFSSGKSTIINHLLDYKDFSLPVGINPVTKLITRIKYGEWLSIYYIKNHRKMLMKQANFKKMVSGKMEPPAGCHTIIIELPARILKQGCVFIDTPGFEDEMGGELEYISRKAVLEADMVVMCASSRLVDIFEKGFVEELNDSVHNFCMVVNHMDQMYTLEDVENVKKQANRMMKGKGGILPKKIFYTTAYGSDKDMGGFDSCIAPVIEDGAFKEMLKISTKAHIVSFRYRRLLEDVSLIGADIEEKLSELTAKHNAIIADKELEADIQIQQNNVRLNKRMDKYRAQLEDKMAVIRERAGRIPPSPLSEYERQIRNLLLTELIDVSIRTEYDSLGEMPVKYISEHFKQYILSFSIPLPREKNVPKTGFLNTLMGAAQTVYNDYTGELISQITRQLKPRLLEELEDFVRKLNNENEEKIEICSGYEEMIGELKNRRNIIQGVALYAKQELKETLIKYRLTA